jgi:hypothetical protein
MSTTFLIYNLFLKQEDFRSDILNTKIVLFLRVSNLRFFADPDPGKNPNVDPDPDN